MVHVPVQDARDVEIAELFERQLHRARRQPNLVSKPNQRAERRTAQARREAAAHAAKVDVEAVVIGDHRQGCKAAFGNLGLAHEAHPRAGQESKIEHDICPRAQPIAAARRTMAQTAIRGAIASRSRCGRKASFLTPRVHRGRMRIPPPGRAQP